MWFQYNDSSNVSCDIYNHLKFNVKQYDINQPTSTIGSRVLVAGVASIVVVNQKYHTR